MEAPLAGVARSRTRGITIGTTAKEKQIALRQRLVLMAADLAALSVAMCAAASVNYNTLSLSILFGHLEAHWPTFLLSALVYLAVFHLFRLYRYAWRFASLDAVWAVVGASTVGVVALVSMDLLFGPPTMLEPRLLFVFWLLSILLVGGSRIALRVRQARRSGVSSAPGPLPITRQPRRAVILGAGGHGARLCAALEEDPDHQYEVVAFLDDDAAKHGTYIRHARVVGPLDHLYDLLREHAVEEVLVAVTGVDGHRLRDYVMACRQRGVAVRIVPGFRAMLNGKAQLRLDEFSVEDLLRRPPVDIDLAAVGAAITGRRVLITGAGGSIGSELCRQVSAFGPSSVYLFGHGECSIHRAYTQLCQAFPDRVDRYHMVIGSVADEARVRQVLLGRKPDVVFHTAAHKHVPIMEQNVVEAVKNNVLGTYYVADACGVADVDRLVLISTDKAVAPSSVMGATKWLCEQVVQAMASRYPGTTYLAVRFGNVLDSRGSVVPLFREQLRRGGPLTVTHPDVTRYFMTIREAVQLVLEAAVGSSGELYILDMGQPVRILDLARDMIRLSGFEPDVDIPITFTGLRPGEKLSESLVCDSEIVVPTAHERLSLVRREACMAPETVFEVVERFRDLVERCDEVGVRRLLVECVPSLAEYGLGIDTLPVAQVRATEPWATSVRGGG